MLTLILALGAIFRITRFVNSDTLFQPVRDRVDDAFGPDSRPAYLLSCAWCASIWVALLVTLSGALAGDTVVWKLIAFALTASYVYGVASQRLDSDH